MELLFPRVEAQMGPELEHGVSGCWPGFPVTKLHFY